MMMPAKTDVDAIVAIALVVLALAGAIVGLVVRLVMWLVGHYRRGSRSEISSRARFGFAFTAAALSFAAFMVYSELMVEDIPVALVFTIPLFVVAVYRGSIKGK